MTTKITVKQGEAKNIKFTITVDGETPDLTDTIATFGVKATKDDTEYTLFKEDEDFDRSEEADGILRLNLDADDLTLTAGTYFAELKIWFSETSIDKSEDIKLKVVQAVIEE